MEINLNYFLASDAIMDLGFETDTAPNHRETRARSAEAAGYSLLLLSGEYQLRKGHPWSDRMLRTEYGYASLRSAWLDISVYTSSVRYLKDVLWVGGKAIRSIGWETFYVENSLHSVREQVVKSLGEGFSLALLPPEVRNRSGA